MKIATVLHCHRDTEVVLDTLESIQTFVGPDVLVLIDGAKWDDWGKHLCVPAYKLQGFHHNHYPSPYRNVILGQMKLAELVPDADWYLHTEYDALFVSDVFKEDLAVAYDENVWCMGNSLREEHYRLPPIEKALKRTFRESRYFLGCVQFFHAEFMQLLKDINFFDAVLTVSNYFRGKFPGFTGFDVGEHIFPTVAHSYGGKLREFATWEEDLVRGNHRRYPIRYYPEITLEENFPEAAIFHPTKKIDALRKVRKHERTLRQTDQKE